MRFISAIYKSRRNFRCMTRGYSQQLNFQLQKVDGEQSGRQNWTKTLDFWFSFYIHFQRDPKRIALRYIHFPFRTWCTFETPYSSILLNKSSNMNLNRTFTTVMVLKNLKHTLFSSISNTWCAGYELFFVMKTKVYL